MSFKLKTITLFLITSLIPSLLIIFYVIYETKEKVITEISQDLSFDVKLVSSRLDNQIKVVYKDFIFISKLDIMDDIISADMDRRVTNLLIRKKEDMELVGDFFIVNLKNKTVASSNPKILGKDANLTSLDAHIFKTDIIATFNNEKIGTFYLLYSYENFKKNLKTKDGQGVYLYDKKRDKNIFKSVDFSDSLTKSKTLTTLNSLDLYITIDKKSSLTPYNEFLFILFLSALVGIFLISLVSIYFASKITKPINTLSKTAILISDTKNYSQRVDISSKDEIGILAKAFNRLIVSIEDALQKLEVENTQKLKLIEEKSKNEMFESLARKLSKYLSPQIYDSIFEGKQDVVLESKRKKLTIFFSDIVGFTDTTESMESEDLSEILNHYLNEMSIIALNHGATIDKFIGDAILIFFGDPKSKGIKEDAINCIKMSLEMIKKIEELEGYWQDRGITKPFRVRIGIHTGFCTVGNFGSDERMDYTIIGGTVNTASRIESKANPNEIWISEETYLLIKSDIECQKQEPIIAKGISKPIEIYKVIGYVYDNKKYFVVDNTLDGLAIKNSKIEIGDRKEAIKSLENLLDEIKKR